MTSGPAIRAWATAHGYTVARRGRIAPDIHAAYQAANPGAAPAEPPTSKGATCGKCGRVWTALREAHCPVCHRQFASVRWFDDHRKGMGKNECRDPELIPVSRNNPEPKYKIIASAWGDVVSLAAERPDSFDMDDADNGVLL